MWRNGQQSDDSRHQPVWSAGTILSTALSWVCGSTQIVLELSMVDFYGIASLLTWIVELDRRVEVDRNLSNNKAHLLIYFGVVTNKDLVCFLLLWGFFRLWIFYSLCIVSQTYHCMHSSCTGYSRKRHPSLSSSSRFQWRAVTAVSTHLSDFVESPSWLKKTQTIGIKQNKTDRSKRWSCASWSRALRWQRFGL